MKVLKELCVFQNSENVGGSYELLYFVLGYQPYRKC